MNPVDIVFVDAGQYFLSHEAEFVKRYMILSWLNVSGYSLQELQRFFYRKWLRKFSKNSSKMAQWIVTELQCTLYIICNQLGAITVSPSLFSAYSGGTPHLWYSLWWEPWMLVTTHHQWVKDRTFIFLLIFYWVYMTYVMFKSQNLTCSYNSIHGPVHWSWHQLGAPPTWCLVCRSRTFLHLLLRHGVPRLQP